MHLPIRPLTHTHRTTPFVVLVAAATYVLGENNQRNYIFRNHKIWVINLAAWCRAKLHLVRSACLQSTLPLLVVQRPKVSISDLC